MKLASEVAVVAGGTRGAGRGIAIALGTEGATVYVTGRSSRAAAHRPWPARRPSRRPPSWSPPPAGQASPSAWTTPTRRCRPAGRAVREEQGGRLDILVNDIWGGDPLAEWGMPFWQHNLDNGLRLLRQAIDTHIITSWHLAPLMVARGSGLVVEITDGASRATAVRSSTTWRRPASSGWRSRRRPNSARTASPRSRSLPASSARRRCSTSSASPRRTGATAPPATRTSSRPRRRVPWVAPWRRWPRTQTSAASTGQALSYMGPRGGVRLRRCRRLAAELGAVLRPTRAAAGRQRLSSLHGPAVANLHGNVRSRVHLIISRPPMIARSPTGSGSRLQWFDTTHLSPPSEGRRPRYFRVAQWRAQFSRTPETVA